MQLGWSYESSDDSSLSRLNHFCFSNIDWLNLRSFADFLKEYLGVLELNFSYIYLNDLKKRKLRNNSNNHKKEPQPLNILSHVAGYDRYKLALLYEYKEFTQYRTEWTKTKKKPFSRWKQEQKPALDPHISTELRGHSSTFVQVTWEQSQLYRRWLVFRKRSWRFVTFQSFSDDSPLKWLISTTQFEGILGKKCSLQMKWGFVFQCKGSTRLLLTNHIFALNLKVLSALNEVKTKQWISVFLSRRVSKTIKSN